MQKEYENFQELSYQKLAKEEKSAAKSLIDELKIVS